MNTVPSEATDAAAAAIEQLLRQGTLLDIARQLASAAISAALTAAEPEITRAERDRIRHLATLRRATCPAPDGPFPFAELITPSHLARTAREAQRAWVNRAIRSDAWDTIVAPHMQGDATDAINAFIRLLEATA